MDTKMNTEMPKVKRESKNRIKVEFDRAPLKDRLKAKFLSGYFLTNVVWFLFRFVILLGVSFVILYPFFSKIAGSFMSQEDFIDVTVRLVPKNPTLDTYKAIFNELGYWEAFTNTLILSFSCAVLQMLVSCLVGYGLAKFKFKGNMIVFLAVILTMVVPHSTIQLSMFMKFRYFDVFNILELVGGLIKWDKPYLELTNTFAPLIILSATGLAFKNGLYIFLMRQFFLGVPDELEESAYIDGSGTLKTFVRIILPLSVPMMVTVFLFAFSWQWTDEFYTDVFFTNTKTLLMPNIVDIPNSLATDYAGQSLFYSAINNTCGLVIIAPLIIMYLFCQRSLVQGIERSGIVG
ncbi:MAG: carbohydrate ABC transporter permease [Clostridia bacterium]|nr:carbohydrate ABC transporter permease [Clostridia bacterium]